jgi:hypothetical protein
MQHDPTQLDDFESGPAGMGDDLDAHLTPGSHTRGAVFLPGITEDGEVGLEMAVEADNGFSGSCFVPVTELRKAAMFLTLHDCGVAPEEISRLLLSVPPCERQSSASTVA